MTTLSCKTVITKQKLLIIASKHLPAFFFRISEFFKYTRMILRSCEINQHTLKL